tara:strand:- start:506 stop:670 length:165 start_codon:yes stop_codon:yes gene_type:complete
MPAGRRPRSSSVAPLAPDFTTILNVTTETTVEESDTQILTTVKTVTIENKEESE